jgi:hypothetical protein
MFSNARNLSLPRSTLKAFARLPGVGVPGFYPSFMLPATPGFPSSCRSFQFRNFLPPGLAPGCFFGILFNGCRTFGNFHGDIIRARKQGFEEADAPGVRFGGLFGVGFAEEYFAVNKPGKAARRLKLLIGDFHVGRFNPVKDSHCRNAGVVDRRAVFFAKYTIINLLWLFYEQAVIQPVHVVAPGYKR